MATVVTHNGRFHADEIIACAIIDLVKCGSHIVRTRDKEVIKDHGSSGAHIVDVGDKYHPEGLQFDHHQTDCNEFFDDNCKKRGIPLSSCGLVYREYGKDLIYNAISRWENALNDRKDNKLQMFDDIFSPDTVIKMYKDVYYRCICEFDANDNGVEINIILKNDGKTFYQNNHLGQILSRYNTSDVSNDELQLTAFHKAFELAKTTLIKHIRNIIEYHWTKTVSYKLVKHYWDASGDKSIIVFNENIASWRPAVAKLDSKKEVRYVIIKRKENLWHVLTIRKSGTRFGLVAPIMSQDKAKELWGNSVIFAHKNLFLAGCRSRMVAWSLAMHSLLVHKKNESTKRRNRFLKWVGIGLLVGAVAFGFIKHKHK
jgi:uncharacterized UPF0160 family protein